VNILPLIFIFITILAITSYSFLHERMASHTELKSYRGYMRAERLARNRLESKRFQKIPQDNRGQGQPKTYKSFISQRTQTPPSEASRLNISPLFSPNPPHFLLETTARLIKILYGHADFFKEANDPDLEYRLVALLREKFENQPPDSFADLFTSDPAYYTIFYKMIRGTNHYDLKRKMGYPPLDDFFALASPKTKICIQFPYASGALLEALWGDKIADSILKMEEKKWDVDRKRHTLVENELQTLLTNLKDSNAQLSQLKEFLSFSAKRPKLDNTRHTDETTHITVKKTN
jgi:hypothetical protein